MNVVLWHWHCYKIKYFPATDEFCGLECKLLNCLSCVKYSNNSIMGIGLPFMESAKMIAKDAVIFQTFYWKRFRNKLIVSSVEIFGIGTVIGFGIVLKKLLYLTCHHHLIIYLRIHLSLVFVIYSEK
jgi:hypothetical protein